MPPSQLKSLKSSLRENGLVGPQRSKKQKKQSAGNGASDQQRVQRNTALLKLREQFNPFEVKTPARGIKFEYTSRNGTGATTRKGILGRPGVTKGLGEENRKKTLLVEMQRRHKVGGLTDRRFGEDDPTMTPDQKMLERFTKETQRRAKGDSLFDLEGDEEGQLTHFGQSLGVHKGTGAIDDFDEDDLRISDDEHPPKRRRLSESGLYGEQFSSDEAKAQSERKKSKADVMKEVMAKSKLHKHERLQVKEDDDDLREELDKELPNVYAMVKDRLLPPSLPAEVSTMNPDRLALLNGSDKSQKDKEYDERIRQMAFDKRSMPTERTKTEEEKVAAEATRLQDLEQSRRRRMQGIESQSEGEGDAKETELRGDIDFAPDDAAKFGFRRGITDSASRQLHVEDEDDFIIDDHLVADGSDADVSDDGSTNGSSVASDADGQEDDDAFTQGLLSVGEMNKPEFASRLNEGTPQNGATDSLAYTYPCPQTHEELLQVINGVSTVDLPIVVQRIRALHHPKLQSDNKAKLGVFSTVLMHHISYIANQPSRPPFAVLETLIRQLHSLAKSYPDEIGRAFRSHLRILQEARPLEPTPGDLIMLTGIWSIFPTSDHFHQVVTPAVIVMTRYMSQKLPQKLTDLATGAYIETLCLEYQRLARRYIPELVNYALNALSILAPAELDPRNRNFPYHEPMNSLRLLNATRSNPPLLRFWDVKRTETSAKEREQFKLTLLETHVALLNSLAEMWAGDSASIEVLEQVHLVLQHLRSSSCEGMLPLSTREKVHQTALKVENLLGTARLSRRPLLLHNHRPLAIKTSIPKFEESYHPDKHYDPDRERAESKKLQAEYKRERKGALRELRKDSNFIAREDLREKKERDAEYEKKYRRLVAEIQGEEGKEANAYDREKRMRKGKR